MATHEALYLIAHNIPKFFNNGALFLSYPIRGAIHFKIYGLTAAIATVAKECTPNELNERSMVKPVMKDKNNTNVGEVFTGNISIKAKYKYGAVRPTADTLFSTNICNNISDTNRIIYLVKFSIIVQRIPNFRVLV